MLDLTTAREISGGDESFIVQVLQMFLNKIETHRASIEKEWKAGEREALAQAAHKLKSACGVIGALQLSADLKQLEVRSRDESVDGAEIDQRVQEALKLSYEVEAEVKKVLSEL